MNRLWQMCIRDRGTLGRSLVEGAEEVKLFGEPVEVRARIETLAGISGHADKQGLIQWIDGLRTKPRRVFIVHGEDQVCDSFAECLRSEHGYSTTAPYSGESWDLVSNVRVAEGSRERVVKRAKAAKQTSTVYDLSLIHIYLGIIPGFGVPGFLVPHAMNRYFRHYKLDFRARWCISHEKLYSRIEESLARDLPVLLAVGQNIPFWRKHKLCLYRQENGLYFPAAEVKAHFVVVTGLENGYLQISSWGRCV